jgi:hypothetical protein
MSVASKFIYAKHGDLLEQENWTRLSDLFPNHEKYWQEFVVPITSRNSEVYGITLLPKAPSDWAKISQIHYSIFYHLTFASKQLGVAESKPIEGNYIENFYYHFGSAIDLVDEFISRLKLTMGVPPPEMISKNRVDRPLSEAGPTTEPYVRISRIRLFRKELFTVERSRGFWHIQPA